MKRIIALSLAAIMMIAVFAGCGSDKKESSDKSVTAASVLAEINKQYPDAVGKFTEIKDKSDLKRYYSIDESKVLSSSRARTATQELISKASSQSVTTHFSASTLHTTLTDSRWLRLAALQRSATNTQFSYLRRTMTTSSLSSRTSSANILL